jgi:hypothetical protein
MQKKIKDIEVGDLVKSWDFDEEKIVPSKVLKLWKHKNDKQCYKLNDKLTITGSHQVYTKDGYKYTKDIEIGDKLLCSDGMYKRVKSFKLYQLDVPYVHNLTVKIDNYFADGVLVHNTGAGGTWGKAGKWHGKDAPAQAAIDSLKDSLIAYNETIGMMQDTYSEQTGELGEKLDLQRKELSVQMKSAGQAGAQESAALDVKLGATGLATVGGEQRMALEQKRQSEGEAFGVKGEGLSLASEHEKAALSRTMDKEKMSMKQSLRGSITSSRAAVLQLDDEWRKDTTGQISSPTGGRASNPFRRPRDPQSMLDRYAQGDKGFEQYCVTPDTKVEMWD